MICFFSEPIFTQRFQNLNNEFPFPEIRDIMQDHYGFLWFATINGIVRYDGYRFKHYVSGDRPEDLNGRYLESLLEDSKGRIWVGLGEGRGLEKFNRNTEKFTNICLRNSKTDSCYTYINIYKIKEDLDSMLWIGTNDGLIHFDPNEERIISHFQNNPKNDYSYNDQYALEICIDRNNTVWSSGFKGMNKYNRINGTFENKRVNPNYLEGQILDIVESTDGKLLVSGRHTKDRIFQYEPSSDSFLPIFKLDKSISNYIKFDLDHNGDGIFGTRSLDAGIFSLKKKECTVYNKEKSSHHGYFGQRINDVFVDKYGNAWIGGQGAFYKPASGKKNQIIKGNGYAVKSIHTIGKDVLYSLDRPFIWKHETKLSSEWWTFPPLKNVRKFKYDLKPIPQIYEIQKWDNNHLVLTTSRNILLYNIETKKMVDYPQNSGGMFLDFIKGNNYDLYIAEGNDYLRLFNFRDKNFVPGNQGPIGKILNVTNAGIDSLGNHWYGMSNGGVYKYNEETNELDHIKLEFDSLGTITATSLLYEIYTHSSGQIYFGTDNGLWQFNNKTQKLRHWNVEDGIQSNVIASINEDENGNLWMGTGTGLTMFDRSKNTFRNYSAKDGFINNTYWWGSTFKGEDSTLYFGGAQGIDFFKPNEITINNVAPDLHLGMLKVNGELYNDGLAFENLKSVLLNYNQNYLEVELLGIHLTAPNSTQYAFQINDQPWQSIGSDRKLTLSNLSSGTYMINAKASNSDGIWSDEKVVLTFQILPPWWKTKWFYLVVLLTFLGSILTLYRYRIQQTKTKERRQTELNKRFAEIELKALQAQMNPHFLFNSLNSVKSFISKGENALAANYLTQFSKLIRLILNNSREKFVRLNDELEALSLYLDLESARFGASFNYEIKVGDNVSSDFLEVPPMLLQPFVENSIWHGLLHKEVGDRNLKVEIIRSGDLIKMIVEDNGIGRAAAAKLQTRSSSKKESLGMKITQDRLDLLRSIYGGGASIRIEDLIDSQNKVKGTRVIITLPIPE